ncbi:MAG: hypothetical protein OXC95_00630 [Dehalococcoidia bacterium]|nr:hypothetical protein [Dehalococcoidia bacterium]
MQKHKEPGYEVYPVYPDDSVRKYISGMTTKEKAETIVRLLLMKAYGDQARIEKDGDGADLNVVFDDGHTIRIEAKGTAKDETKLWEGLVVSSQSSHDALKSGEVVMFRVVDVDSASPRIYVLEHGRDYYMEPEPRWSVKRAEPTDRKRYPFVGEPYRYDDPYEPVALDEWEALK